MKSEKYSVETPMSLSFEAKAENGLLKFELAEEQGESSISIGDYTIYKDIDGNFAKLYKYDGARDEDIKVEGEEIEKISSEYGDIIEEAETELAEQIKSIICESLADMYLLRKIHILDKQNYNLNKSSYNLIYQVSNNLGIYLHHIDIPTISDMAFYLMRNTDLSIEKTDLDNLSDMQDEDVIECYNLIKEFEAQKEEAEEKFEERDDDYIENLINDMTFGGHLIRRENLESYYEEQNLSGFFTEYDEYYWTILMGELQEIVDQYELDCYR